MDNNCLILGAGFSKAVANLPLTNEMYEAFKAVLSKEQKKEGKNNRSKWGKELLSELELLEEEFLINRYKEFGNNRNVISSNYLNNFEGICSFIDLNLAYSVQASCKIGNKPTDFSGFPPFSKLSINKLKQLRKDISLYIYLTLINSNDNPDLLDKFYNKILNKTSSVITFNYDLILEKYLYSKKLWFPKDGYGFTSKYLDDISDEYINCITKTKILKMHGSLNWQLYEHLFENIKLENMHDKDYYYFPNYYKNENPRNFEIQGGKANGAWILPSLFKQFNYPELFKVWNKAAKALIKAEEIIVVGYSFPNADSAVYSLFASMDFDNKNIIVIDKNANSMKDRYYNIFRTKNITIVNKKLEDYLN